MIFSSVAAAALSNSLSDDCEVSKYGNDISLSLHIIHFNHGMSSLYNSVAY